MKEDDYLWDKKGSDTGIERLERAVGVFRYKESAPPQLPAKILPFRQAVPRNFFRFSLAAAACAVLAVISLGIWLQISKTNTSVMPDLTEIDVPGPDVLSPQTKTSPTTKIFINPKRTYKRKLIPPRKLPSSIVDRNMTTAKNMKTRETAHGLTRHELYAYNQLMLALSITGSKLKLVSDKVEAADELNAHKKDGQ